MNTSKMTLTASALVVALASSAHAQDDAPTVQPGLAPVVAPAPAPVVDEKKKEEDAKNHFYEHGRFGVVGALTEDLWKGGFAFEHEYFEIQLLGHVGSLANDSREIDVRAKAGARFNLGKLNYLAAGVEFGFHPGAMDSGIDVSGEYQVGPYVGLQRYFAATPVMLLLWVNPVQYDHSLLADASGKVTSQNAIRFFQTGGLGLAYMF